MRAKIVTTMLVVAEDGRMFKRDYDEVVEIELVDDTGQEIVLTITDESGETFTGDGYIEL